MFRLLFAAILAAVLFISIAGCENSDSEKTDTTSSAKLTSTDWTTLAFNQLLTRILASKDIAQLEAEVETGTPEAMTSLAIALTAFGNDEAVDFAQDLYASACEDGFQRACIEQAISQYGSTSISVLGPEDAKALSVACDQGAAVGCYFALAIKMDILTASDDLQDYADAYSDLCDSGVAAACFSLGVMSEEGFGIKMNRADAINAYIKGCRINDGGSCTNLGIFYLRGERVSQDNDKAKDLFEKACSLTDTRGCTNYASLIGPTKAAKIYEEQCDQGDGLACANLGRMTYYGRGVERHLSNGRRLLEQGCGLGEAYACQILKDIT